MSATQRPGHGSAESDESAEDQFPPSPDEDGPHDVPDDQVIEKTLPSTPRPDSERSRR
jgi:hypothetical protein